MKPAQAKLLNTYRDTHDLDVCSFPLHHLPTGKVYKFYITHKGKVAWNPMVKNGEGKIVSYLYFTYEEGLAEALKQAKLLTLK
ncbi:MAG TPA: hypothetical protein VF598_07720 [Hymenobacter sp.]